jgi:hypothetical protein
LLYTQCHEHASMFPTTRYNRHALQVCMQYACSTLTPTCMHRSDQLLSPRSGLHPSRYLVVHHVYCRTCDICTVEQQYACSTITPTCMHRSDQLVLSPRSGLDPSTYLVVHHVYCQTNVWHLYRRTAMSMQLAPGNWGQGKILWWHALALSWLVSHMMDLPNQAVLQLKHLDDRLCGVFDLQLIDRRCLTNT